MHDRKSLDYAPSASGPRSRADARGSRLSRSEHPAGKAVRARQRILAVFLPVTAVLYISCEALDPRGTDQVVTSMAVAFRLLPIAAAHPSRLYLAGSLSLLALGGLAVSYAAIALLVTGRGWVIATVAATLGAVGAFAGALFNVLVGVNLAAAASAHMTQTAAARFLVTSFGSVPAQVAEYAYFVGEYAAPVVMGFALWRSRAVPRWLAVLVHRRAGTRRDHGILRPDSRAVHAAVRRRDDLARGLDLAGRRPPRCPAPRHRARAIDGGAGLRGHVAAHELRELT